MFPLRNKGITPALGSGCFRDTGMPIPLARSIGDTLTDKHQLEPDSPIREKSRRNRKSQRGMIHPKGAGRQRPLIHPEAGSPLIKPTPFPNYEQRDMSSKPRQV